MINKRYIIFGDTGEILRNVVCPEEMIGEQLKIGERYIEGVADDTLHYINSKTLEISDKTEFAGIISKEVIVNEVISFCNLPVITHIRVDLLTYAVESGEFKISFPDAGEHVIVFKSVTKLKKEIRVIVKGG